MRSVRNLFMSLGRWTALSTLAILFCTLGTAMEGCSGGSAASAPAPSPVVPSISTQPASASVVDGGMATFTVAASGTPSPGYQWLLNGTAIAGATSASYTTPALSIKDSGGSYSVGVSNTAGSVTSSAAIVTVTAKPAAITVQPANTTVTDGGTASFSVTATGTAPIVYQWYRGASAVAGATSSSYTYAAVYADSGAVFSVKVSNSAATVTSNSATITVNAAAVSITAQPQGSATRFAGETGSFSVTATGTAPLSYQWRRNAAAIAGATSTSYTTAALTTSDNAAVYDVIVTNPAGSVTSSGATLPVGPFATNYTTQKGVKLNLYAWPGSKYAFLSKTNTINPVTMRSITTAADGAWNYYAGVVGKLPSIFFNYNGLGTIADTGVGGVDLCGAGCTYVGATGMEIDDDVANALYNKVPTQYDWVMFYETGRSFWLFHDQLEYKSPDNSSCEVTGFAVFMGIHSLLALGLPTDYGTGTPNNPDPMKTELLDIDYYASNSSLNFQNTFLTSTFSSPDGGDCPVLWTGLVQRLYLAYGGETFLNALFKQALLRPTATTTQDAVDNFVLAASAAAGKNLTYTFGTTWKWPISTSATNEAKSKYGNPQ